LLLCVSFFGEVIEQNQKGKDVAEIKLSQIVGESTVVVKGVAALNIHRYKLDHLKKSTNLTKKRTEMGKKFVACMFVTNFLIGVGTETFRVVAK
jgi:hypothetical protein